MSRNDIHTPSNIVPSDYEHLLSFSHSQPWLPGIHMEELRELRRELNFVDIHPDTGQCDSCGAVFIHGDVFMHTPTRECIIVGHVCADNMHLMADRRVWSKVFKLHKKARREFLKRRKARRAVKAFLREHPDRHEITRLLKVDDRITKDIRARFIRWGKISDKQIELMRKIADRKANFEARKAEEKANSCPVPEGRQVIKGEILSVKSRDGWGYGQITYKMLVQVTTPAGQFKVWGTCPSILLDEKDADGQYIELKGKMVEFTATVKRSDKDEAFGFFSRPTKSLLLKEVV